MTVCVVVIFKIIKVDERNRFLKRKFPARTVSSEFFIFKNDKILKGAAVLEFLKLVGGRNIQQVFVLLEHNKLCLNV